MARRKVSSLNQVVAIANINALEIEQEINEGKGKAISTSASRKISIKEVEPKYGCMSDALAEDTLCYLNHYYKGGREKFPNDHQLQFVHKYYPYAKGGPLLIDEPAHKESLEIYTKKQEFMKELGHRYLLVKPKMTELDCREVLA